MTDKEKIVIIIRGPQGSGKTTLANYIVRVQFKGSGEIFSTDDFYLDENNCYKFDPTKLAIAHSWNRGRVRSAMQNGVSPVIIDNVNAQRWEAKPYFELALLYNYKVIVRETMTEWKFDAEECARRTSKGVDADGVRRVMRRWETNFSQELVLSSTTPEQRKLGWKPANVEEVKKRFEAMPAIQQKDARQLNSESEYKRARLKTPGYKAPKAETE